MGTHADLPLRDRLAHWVEHLTHVLPAQAPMDAVSPELDRAMVKAVSENLAALQRAGLALPAPKALTGLVWPMAPNPGVGESHEGPLLPPIQAPNVVPPGTTPPRAPAPSSTSPSGSLQPPATRPVMLPVPPIRSLSAMP